MDKKGKITLSLLLVIIALLSVGVYYLSYKVSTIESSLIQIANDAKNTPIVVNGVDGVDGRDGLNGFNGKDGTNGVNSISTHTKEVYYTPIEGPIGPKGDDAVQQEIRINPETKDLESKTSKDRYWLTLIPCVELLRSCPQETSIEGEK